MGNENLERAVMGEDFDTSPPSVSFADSSPASGASTNRYPAFVADASIEFGGSRFMKDHRGALVPVDLVAPRDALIDETARRCLHFARHLSAQIARFKAHCFGDLAGLQALLEQEYGAPAGGAKGNVTYPTYDGLGKVQVQIADRMEFGPELQVAKRLIDACLAEWGATSHPMVRTLIERVFNVDKEGQIDRAALFELQRLEVADPRWQEAMRAVRDSIRITGTKAYIRFYEKAGPNAPWTSITIDLASAPLGVGGSAG